MAGEAGAVGDDVAQGDQGVGAGVSQAEVVKMFTNRVIPVQLLLVGQHGHGRGGEGLGGGADLEERVDGDRLRLSDLLDPVRLDEDDLVVLHHGDGDGGELPGGEGVARGLVEVLRGGGEGE
jgi:hypothetical protein